MSKFLNVVAAILISSIAAFSQNQPLGLKQLLEAALEHNQNLEVSRYDQDLAEYKIKETRARTLPNITGTATANDNYKRQVLVIPAGAFPSPDGATSDAPRKLIAGTTYTSSAGVDVSQPLFDMAAFTGLKAAQAGRDYYALSTKQSEEEVINQVATAYYSILATRETLILLDSNIQNLKKLVAAAEGQFKNGLARRIDLDRLKVSLINAQSQRTQSANALNAQGNQLKVLVGVPLTTDLNLSNILFEEIEQLPNELSDSAFDASNRTEVKLLDSQIRLSQLQRKAIQAENYPRLSAYFNYTQNVMSNTMGDIFTGTGDAINYGVGAFGLRLNVPIFDGLGRHSRAKQSEVQIRQLQKRREAAILSADASALNARIQMSNSLETLTAQKENMRLAEEVYNASQSNYNLGLTSLTDLLEAQNAYTEAQNIYTRELLNYKLAELEGMRSTGNLQSLLNK